MLYNKSTIYKYYFVTYFFYYVRRKLNGKVDTLIDFSVFSRVQVYTKQACKSSNFLYMGLPL